MQEWIYAAQKLVNYVEDHICENPSLSEISAHIGYSSYYCSEQFHRVAGMTIREYIQKRRLAMAAVELRDCVEIWLFGSDYIYPVFQKRLWVRTIGIQEMAEAAAACL